MDLQSVLLLNELLLQHRAYVKLMGLNALCVREYIMHDDMTSVHHACLSYQTKVPVILIPGPAVDTPREWVSFSSSFFPTKLILKRVRVQPSSATYDSETDYWRHPA